MTAEQEGGFLRLLCHAWDSDPPCTLPNDDDLLAAWSKIGPNWKVAGRLIKKQFVPTRGRRIRNEKLWLIYREVLESSQRRSKAGKEGVKARRRGAKRRQK